MIGSIDDAAYELCFPSPAGCETQRALKLRWTTFQRVSTCRRQPR